MKQVAVALAVLFLALAFVEAAPKPPKVLPPKKVRCTDHHFTTCFHKEFNCPSTCSSNCTVDCNSCQPICGPKIIKPKEVKCTNKLFPSCNKKKMLCPASCPRTCVADCGSCQPVCSPVSPVYTPPPPPSPIYTPPVQVPPSTTTPSPTTSSGSVTATPNPPASEASSKRFGRCMSKDYPHCYQRRLACPPTCPETCHVDCVTCSPVCSCDKPGTVCQDPKFTGADGLTFYFHGKKDQHFCLVSDTNLHINAHFIGNRNADIRRDFTWVQSLGILFDNHQIHVGAKKTATWNDALDRLSLSFDDHPINLNETEGASWRSSKDGVTITRLMATNAVEITVEGNFKLTANVVPITMKDNLVHKYGITKNDCFAHLDLNFKFYSFSGDVDGVLGQTYGKNYVSRVKMGIAMPVLGGDKEFRSSSLFATDCHVAKFTGKGNQSSSSGFDFADINCGSGLTGRGVVCKKR
ncbi:uncharacterized protein LOC141617984 [Silene latifolia]|uniref:uncharacterized protein LOC141617984 n=1 Tax=Silene latifolia TaxID=37657 RepID=UPI003D76CBDE